MKVKQTKSILPNKNDNKFKYDIFKQKKFKQKKV